jgi:hypothetical protein
VTAPVRVSVCMGSSPENESAGSLDDLAKVNQDRTTSIASLGLTFGSRKIVSQLEEAYTKGQWEGRPPWYVG